MDGSLQFMPRFLAIIVVPVALAIMVPLALVFVVLFYINAQVRAVWALVLFVVFRKATPPEPVQKPHFLEAPARKTDSESTSPHR